MASLMFKFGAEPFEEAQVESGLDTTTPDALDVFYAKMQQQDFLQRKMSRAPSSGKRSIWSRKLSKKSLGAPISDDANLGMGNFVPTMAYDQRLDSKEKEEDEMAALDDKVDQISAALARSRSIIPDPLSELPAWFTKENDLNVGHTISYRLKHPIHSPVGPRWYKNHHLIPPAHLRPAGRPTSVFSPSFPPMASSLHDSHEEVHSLHRSQSGSPIATPNSSQPDVATKPRGRKTSQTTPDNVDLLDVTDPWGTHYHHQSPYDPGLSSSSTTTPPTTSFDSQESPTTPRSRRASISGQPRRKMTTPSPLSQSTSALHLQPEIAAHRPRKLSKKRRPVMGVLFGGSTEKNNALSSPSPVLQTESAPVSPLDPRMPQRSSTEPNGIYLAGERSSALPPSMLSAPKEKRGSVLGRLAKKLSIMKRPSVDVVARGSVDDWQHIGMGDTQSGRNSQQSISIPRPSLHEQPSMESRKTDPIKRVPPPSLGLDISDAEPLTSPSRQSADRRSSISIEASPLTIGRLTIANPDASESFEPTPGKSNIPLPFEKSAPPVLQRPKLHDSIDRPKSTLPPLPPPEDLDAQATPISVTQPVLPAVSYPSPEVPPSSHWRPSLTDIPQSPASDTMSLYTTYMNGLSGMSAVNVPFAAAGQRPFSAVSGSTRATIASSPMSFMDDSPLSRASMIVNPPTPSGSTVGIVLAPTSPAPMANTSDASHRPTRKSSPTKADAPQTKVDSKLKVEIAAPRASESRDESRSTTTPTTSRQTETFKLVRTPSAGVMASNEATTAAGEHWEVVGSADKKQSRSKDRSSRSKDREGGSRREHKRTEPSAPPPESQPEAPRKVRQKSVHGIKADQLATPPPAETRASRSGSIDAPRPVQEPSKPARKESSHRNKAQPAPPPPTPAPAPGAPLERRPSAATRPTSELPSTAELNALRAREAWEMDRLWKGRSMYYGAQPEPNGFIVSPPSSTQDVKDPKGSMPSINTDLNMDNGSVRSAGHGSSHTSFKVRSFQSQQPANTIYSNMPTSSPPIVYTPTAYSTTSATYDYSGSYRSSFPSSPPEPLPPPIARSNPLPAPPRESSYQPAPLPTLARPTSSTSEHWTKHPSVTTAH